MNELNFRDFVDFIRDALVDAWRHRWLGMAAAWIVCLAGWGFVATLPNVYEATAKVSVDTQTALQPLLKGLTLQSDLMERVQQIRRAMLTRPNLEQIARESDLDIGSTTPGEQEALISALSQKIKLAGSRDGTLIQIAYSHSNPETARRVVNEVVDNFVERSLDSQQEDSDKTAETLQEQIQEYEARLVESENNLKRFKQEHLGMMPGDRGDYYTRLQTAMLGVSDLETQLDLAIQKRNEIQRQLAGEVPTFGLVDDGTYGGPVSRYDANIASLRQKLELLRIEYTDRHPEIVRIKELIAEYESRRQEELAAAGPTQQFSSGQQQPNLVYQTMKTSLSNVEIEIAELRAQRQSKEAEVEELRRLVDVIPEVEAKLNALNRDYNVVLGRYNTMLERWETLQTARAVKRTSNEISFRVIEPPFVPKGPVGPNRGLLSAGVLVLGIGVFLVLPVLIAQIQPVVVSARQLRSLPVPVLGTVAHIGQNLFARQILVCGVVFVGLLGAFAVAVAFGDNLAQILTRV